MCMWTAFTHKIMWVNNMQFMGPPVVAGALDGCVYWTGTLGTGPQATQGQDGPGKPKHYLSIYISSVNTFLPLNWSKTCKMLLKNTHCPFSVYFSVSGNTQVRAYLFLVCSVDDETGELKHCQNTVYTVQSLNGDTFSWPEMSIKDIKHVSY